MKAKNIHKSDKVLSLQNARVCKGLFLCMFLFTGFAFSQFTVNKATVLSVESLLSSLETKNVVRSSVLGKGVFFLNQKNQKITTESGVVIYGLKIENANELAVLSPLIVGNLFVDAGELTLNNILQIKGGLFLNKSVIIKNRCFLQFVKSFNPFRTLLLSQGSVYKTDIIANNAVVLKDLIPKLNNKFFNYLESLEAQFCKSNLYSPPDYFMV